MIRFMKAGEAHAITKNLSKAHAITEEVSGAHATLEYTI